MKEPFISTKLKQWVVTFFYFFEVIKMENIPTHSILTMRQIMILV